MTCEADDTLRTLLCSVESQTQTSFEWNGPDVVGHQGSKLVVNEDGVMDRVYTCTVKNQVKSTSSDFTLSDCHTGLIRISSEV